MDLLSSPNTYVVHCLKRHLQRPYFINCFLIGLEALVLTNHVTSYICRNKSIQSTTDRIETFDFFYDKVIEICIEPNDCDSSTPR